MSINYFISGAAMATLQGVQITPCPEHPCVLKKGSEETIEVTFTPSKNYFHVTFHDRRLELEEGVRLC